MYGPRGGTEPDFSEERGKKMLYAAIALASVFAFERMGFDIQYRIKAVSMAPTLGDGEIIFSDPFSYALLGREIKREDIVVHQRPGGGNILNIHRVLGIPGDKVMVKFGWV
ncbi:MAG: Peptidase S24-like [Fibrobacteres bacterium]|nr:Peptidase S24-like [Fibrobacterota bacterium]